MYIVSKFHDYYDTAATYGIDKTVVYRRELKQIQLPRYRYGMSTGHDFVHRESRASGRFAISEVLVGFCGKIYPAFMFDDGPSVGYAYDEQSLLDLAGIFGVGINDKAKLNSWSRILEWGGKINLAYARQFFSANHKVEKFFVEHHVPVFTVTLHSGDQYLNLNPTLREIGFQRIKDAPTAFQEIYMYISGVLGAPPKPPEEPSDKLKAQIHGHDGEYSFKKPPGGKKWR